MADEPKKPDEALDQPDAPEGEKPKAPAEPMVPKKDLDALQSRLHKQLAVKDTELKGLKGSVARLENEMADLRETAQYGTDAEAKEAAKKLRLRERELEAKEAEIEEKKGQLNTYARELVTQQLVTKHGIPAEKLEACETLREMELTAREWALEQREAKQAAPKGADEAPKEAKKPAVSEKKKGYDTGEQMGKSSTPKTMTDGDFQKWWDRQKSAAVRGS